MLLQVNARIDPMDVASSAVDLEDPTHVVHLGFEDSTINADEVSYENHEFEDNDTNRYIELLK